MGWWWHPWDTIVKFNQNTSRGINNRKIFIFTNPVVTDEAFCPASPIRSQKETAFHLIAQQLLYTTKYNIRSSTYRTWVWILRLLQNLQCRRPPRFLRPSAGPGRSLLSSLGRAETYWLIILICNNIYVALNSKSEMKHKVVGSSGALFQMIWRFFHSLLSARSWTWWPQDGLEVWKYIRALVLRCTHGDT